MNKLRYPTTMKHQPRQAGSALIVSLIILLVMTIIGVSSLNSTMMEDKMAANNNDMVITFQAAEAANGGGISEAAPADSTFFMDAKKSFQDVHCGSTVTTDPVKNYTLDSTTDAQTELTVKNMAHQINSSMDVFVGYNVEFIGQGTLKTTGAKAVNVQGVIKGPYPNPSLECLTTSTGGIGGTS